MQHETDTVDTTTFVETGERCDDCGRSIGIQTLREFGAAQCRVCREDSRAPAGSNHA